MNDTNSNATTLGDDITFGLGKIRLLHPPGTTPVTPASLTSIEAIGVHRHLLQGIGMDWGSGGGCLSIAAARIPEVNKVVAFDISDASVAIARKNAQLNGIEDKVTFMRSDSYVPFSAGNRRVLEEMKGRTNFLLANPPSSEDDDGFEYRRIVLRGAREFLLDGGRVFLSVSYQYGLSRIAHLERDVPGFFHEGVLATTECVPFDLGRPDLLHCLESYAQEESRGGLEYTFCNPSQPAEGLNAKTALELYERTERSPLSRWQTHLFRYFPNLLQPSNHRGSVLL